MVNNQKESLTEFFVGETVIFVLGGEYGTVKEKHLGINGNSWFYRVERHTDGKLMNCPQKSIRKFTTIEIIRERLKKLEDI